MKKTPEYFGNFTMSRKYLKMSCRHFNRITEKKKNWKIIVFFSPRNFPYRKLFHPMHRQLDNIGLQKFVQNINCSSFLVVQFSNWFLSHL